MALNKSIRHPFLQRRHVFSDAQMTLQRFELLHNSIPRIDAGLRNYAGAVAENGIPAFAHRISTGNMLFLVPPGTTS
ncbi:hypothetical protein [Rhizobium leguminosarum]|uniref:Uncharacterized protein n=1 Tax=Rhizobium leguminosarum TaxID=384 RepID=A0A6P0BBY2_RHILE|nr:hypothetical protein [Rhizobium leguminosarum]MBY5440691.1 hypothetical protein [Rhizobium leguminosarum]NEI36361.1 hypothetical protein [Rhizobium leguminosarum]NEI42628.1 hypothetical protein [Rhizobium leguminosarum]